MQFTRPFIRTLLLGAQARSPGAFNSGPALVVLAVSFVPWYIGTMTIEIERVQTGVRLEKRMLKVLKALAELKDLSLGDLLEGIVLHVFEGKTPFSAQTLKEIDQFRKVYGLTLKASDSHKLKERS